MALGGARPGAGRKKGSVEEDAKGAIKQALKNMSGDKDAMTLIWEKAITEAHKGSYKHAQLVLNYYYGRPVENVNLGGGITVNFTRKVVK